MVSDDPAVQRRRLRVELRRLRQDAGMTQKDVAQAMDWSTSKLIRIESGDVGISSNDLRVLLDHYGVKEKRRVDSMLDMARTARKESWSDYRDVVKPAFLTYLGFESSAQLIRTYEPLLVPGLLQTEEYARAVLTQAYGSTGLAVERQWQARQRRQELLEREHPPKIFFVLDEAVIRRQVGGPGAMRRQLERLKLVSAQPHISLQVLPFAAGAHPGMRGPFVLLEFPDPNDDDLLYLEHVTGDTTVRDVPDQTSPYIDLFYLLEEKALSPEETLALLDRVIEEMAGNQDLRSPGARTEPAT
jgi:transcriptional regulator with XRE-family HTH domain